MRKQEQIGNLPHSPYSKTHSEQTGNTATDSISLEGASEHNSVKFYGLHNG